MVDFLKSQRVGAVKSLQTNQRNTEPPSKLSQKPFLGGTLLIVTGAESTDTLAMQGYSVSVTSESITICHK